MKKFYSIFVAGINAYGIDVEVDVSRGMRQLSIVGLGDTAIQELKERVRKLKERVRSAIKNSGFKFPSGSRITVNLAPGDIRKKGPIYDLAIALGILSSENSFQDEIINNSIFLGELALDGSLRGVNGVLSAAIYARKNNKKYIFLPFENSEEAKVISDVVVISLKNLNEAVEYLTGTKNITINPEGQNHNIIDNLANITNEAREAAIKSTEKLQLSTRAYYRILKLSRTIADIDGQEYVEVRHILEAIS